MITETLTDDEGQAAITITPVAAGHFEAWRTAQSAPRQRWLEACGFKAEPGASLALPGPDGHIACVLFVCDDTDPWRWAQLSAQLPPADYRIDAPLERPAATWAALAWALGRYAYTRYRSAKPAAAPRLIWPSTADRAAASRTVHAVCLARDLINTPAADMGPADIEEAVARGLARDGAPGGGARLRTIVGTALLDAGFPLIHAVGRASTRPPRLIDVVWGNDDAPKVTLVGKGVCFDTGGLDMKNSANMRLMKKDMGGAAIVLALAAMIIDAELPVRLRVLIAAADNAISGDAFRPLDVLNSRKGLTIEVGNTDAEGRLLLADALCAADEEQPALLIDVATLTGAARVALGPEVAPFFTADDQLAADLLAAGQAAADPLWRLPLWTPYRALLDSKVADINNAGDSPHAGSITAALFLREFVTKTTAWVHLDVYGWNARARPGRPRAAKPRPCARCTD